ncbi:TonB-dependent siderophore receptor [Puniceicoccaceae bacterium K14]|nr:TonB-dependent siderophore receptor [Puniceicoccaceae bacterium K14]
MNSLSKSIAGFTVSALALSSLSIGQESINDTSPLSGETNQTVDLEEFTVFGEQYDTIGAATRLPLSLRETPQSVSTIDSSRFEAENMFNLSDIMRNVTGVNVSLYDTQRPLFFSRGFQITDIQVDGIPTYSQETNQDYDAALYESVEIVRGANGLLSGAGKPSGTINFHRKQPKTYFDASIRQSVGSWNHYRTETDLNVPLTKDGKFRSRIVAAYTDRDGFHDRYHNEQFAFLASFAGDLTENTTITFGYQLQDNNPTASVWGSIPLFAEDGSPADLPHTTNFATNWASWQRESRTAFVNLEQAFGENWQLKAAFNLTDGDEVSKSVYADTWGGTGAPGLNKSDGSGLGIIGSYWDTDDERQSIDIYLNGKYSLFDRDHDLVVGFSHSDYDLVSPNDANFWTHIIPNIYEWDGNAPEFDPIPAGTNDFISTTHTGLYTSTRIKLSDSFSTILGARLSNWETEQLRYGTAADYEVDSEITPYVGFTFDINENTTLYGSYTSIFQPQSATTIGGSILDPVDGSNFEFGVKASFAEGRTTLTAAIFETKQDNLAIADGLPIGEFQPFIGVDGTKSEGIELQLTGEINEDLSIIFGYTFNDTSRHDNDAIYTNLPDHLVQLSTHYEWNDFAFGAGLTWQSELTGSSWNPVTQGSFLLANFHVNYRINEHFTATLSAKNAFDEIYLANLDYANYGEPRNVVFSLKYKF